MKGKLSRMWRSGLSMMLALIMMFSLGTVAFATEGSATDTAKDVAEDASVVVKNLADIFQDYADCEKAEAIAKYVYASFEEQGYVALVVAALEEVCVTLDKAIAEVDNVVTNLSPELKAELKSALESAKAAVVELKDAAVNAKDLDTEVTQADLKAAADVAVEKLQAAKDVVESIIDAGTKEDAALLKDTALKAIDAAISAARKLAELVVAAVIDATTESIVVPCGGYNVVALGDGSAAGYAALVADELGANLTDLSAAGKEAADDLGINNAAVVNADMVLLGYGFDGITDYVAGQLSTTEPNAIDWSSVFEGTDTIEPALAKVEEYLNNAGVDNEVINMTLVALESYAYGYAKYLVDYPMLVNDIHDVNEDALVVVVGMYNPLKGVSLTAGDVSIDLGLCLDLIVEASGIYNLASAILLPNCIYVEAQDVATSLNGGAMSAEKLAYTVAKDAEAMLPTAAGAAYIKGAIMDALTVDAQDHVWDEGVISGADKYLKTLITYTCINCGATKTEAWDKMHYMFFAGYPDGSFGTERSITREEVAVVFYAMLNEKYQVADEAYVFEGKFSDVAEGEWYTKQIEVLSSLGIIAGYPDGTFGVGKAITRAEFATMAVALGQFEIDGTEMFPDVAEGDWFYDYVRTAANNGCVAGYPDGTFKPDAAITRAEAAVIACNMAGRPYECAKEYFDHYSAAKQIPVDVVLGENGAVAEVTSWAEINVLNDVPGHWAYYWLVEASNTHYHEIGLS